MFSYLVDCQLNIAKRCPYYLGEKRVLQHPLYIDNDTIACKPIIKIILGKIENIQFSHYRRLGRFLAKSH